MRWPKVNTKNTLILYLGLGPIFWFGPIEIQYFKVIKLLIFLVLFFFTLFNSILNRKLTHNKSFVALVLLLFLTSFFGFLQSTPAAVLSVSFTYILLLLVSWVFYSYFKNKNFDEILDVFLKATKIITIFCAFIITNHWLEFVDWKYLSELTESYAWAVKLADTGFSTGRTNWSNGLSLYFIVAVYAYYKHDKKPFIYYALIILLTQILSGGRGGLLISTLVFLSYLLPRLNFKWLLISSITLITLIGMNQEYLKKRFRLNKLEKNDENALDNFTAGRLGHFLFAFENISEDFNYFKGNGFLKEENKIEGETEIHFLWLKKMLEGGIFYLTVYVLFVLLFLVRIIRLVLKDRKYIIFLHLLIAGILTTFLEPNAIFGSLQSSMMWWAGITAAECIRIQLAYNNIDK